jgi:predicted RNA-binding protein with PIN domain
MPFLIDGHNLIPKIPGLSLAQPDKEDALIRLLQNWCAAWRKTAEVYFDKAPPGQAGSRKFGAVTARYVPASHSADSAIGARLARLAGAARGWVVVSSDRQVQAEARSAGARALPAETFAAQLLAAPPASPAAETPLSPQEVDEWLALFEETPRA